MAERPGRILARHPDPSKKGTRIDAGIYEAFRRAILKAVGRKRGGLPFKDLPARVRPLLPADTRETIGSVTWYTTTVKLDLEARGLIERVPGRSPQHLRRR